jgi:DNA-binding NarL/FixJ family response regulator
MENETGRKKQVSILIVDDEPELRNLISVFLADMEGYTIYTSSDPLETLNTILPRNHIDLILSDINMPNMLGFELLNKVRELYPDITRVLITAGDVDEYFDLAMKHDVGNIFVKTVPFNFDELSTILNSLLTKDIFGAARYMEEQHEKKTFLVKRGDNLDTMTNEILSWLPADSKNRRIELVLVELLTNAIFYGVRSERPDRKDTWEYDFELSDEDAIQVVALYDSQKYAISIVDKGGRLKKKDVLFWLHRQIEKDDNGLPIGVLDLHGRGFFIARKYIDRLLINVETNKKTEVIIINYFNEVYSGFKPLYINEI